MTVERRAVSACPRSAGHSHLFSKGTCVSCGITEAQRAILGWGRWDTEERAWVHAPSKKA
jgi:ribosomal protein L37E